MANKIDIKTLQAFMEWSGGDFYFKAQPLIPTGRSGEIRINAIEFSQLLEWVEDFNKLQENKEL